MKTTLAILGIFAAAVLATTFAVNAYAISQTNNVNQESRAKKHPSQPLQIKLVYLTLKRTTTTRTKTQSKSVKNTAGLCTFC